MYEVKGDANFRVFVIVNCITHTQLLGNFFYKHCAIINTICGNLVFVDRTKKLALK